MRDYKLEANLFRMGFTEEWIDESMPSLMTLRRLARKHHRLAEMECNGEGCVKGIYYRLDGSTPGAYVSEDVSIFSAESDKVEVKIKKIAEKIGLTVEFQGDPRGYTVKFYDQQKRFVDVQGE